MAIWASQIVNVGREEGGGGGGGGGIQDGWMDGGRGREEGRRRALNKKAAFSQTPLWQSCIRKEREREGRKEGRVQWNYQDIDLRRRGRVNVWQIYSLSWTSLFVVMLQ